MSNQGAKGYQETLLVDTLDRMRRNPEGRKVVHLRLSQLMPQNRTTVRIKIVTRMFRTLESGRQVQIFSLTNDDLAMIVNAGAQRDVNNIIHRIRKLFEGDPLTLDDDGGNDRFAVWYDLALDSAMAIHAAQQMRQQAQQAQPRGPAQQLPTITPPALDEIHKKLAFLNVVPFVRDQVALRIDRTTNEASIEFFEFFLSVGDIQRTVAPNWNLFGDRSLFQDLSRTMDLRMLDIVVRAPHAREAPSISLNLNLETIFTPAFSTFLERMESKKVIVEVQAVDLLTNFAMYLDAQAVLSGMGHAVLIDGLTTSALSMLDIAQMKPDYAKIIWAPELLDMMDPATSQSAAFIVQGIGAEKVILSRCDSANALAWGLKTGISVFQGHFLDAYRKKAAAVPRRRPA